MKAKELLPVTMFSAIDYPAYRVDVLNEPRGLALASFLVYGFKENPANIDELSRDRQAGEFFDTEIYRMRRLCDARARDIAAYEADPFPVSYDGHLKIRSFPTYILSRG